MSTNKVSSVPKRHIFLLSIRKRLLFGGAHYPSNLLSSFLLAVILPSQNATPGCEAGNLPVQLALVESKLLTLQDVAIAAARLARTARNNGVQATSLKLTLESVVDLARGGKAGGLLLLNRAGLLHGLLDVALLLLPPAAEGLAVVGLVPLAERSGIDLNNGRLGQGVGADQLVVGRVVDDTDDTRLAGAALRGPGKVARVQTQSAVLVVAAAGADGVNALGTDTGVGGLAAGLESALLPYWQRSERMSMVKNKDGESVARQTSVVATLSLFFSQYSTGFRKTVSQMSSMY